jgi:hypothetical protein
MKNCKDLHILLQDGQNSNIDGTDLFEELLSCIQVLSYFLDVLKYLTESKLNLVYPNICIAIRILLTLPVTTATAERSFSKLKLIKNYLRSNTSQERLVGLMMMSIKRKILHVFEITEYSRPRNIPDHRIPFFWFIVQCLTHVSRFLPLSIFTEFSQILYETCVITVAASPAFFIIIPLKILFPLTSEIPSFHPDAFFNWKMQKEASISTPYIKYCTTVPALSTVYLFTIDTRNLALSEICQTALP